MSRIIPSIEIIYYLSNIELISVVRTRKIPNLDDFKDLCRVSKMGTCFNIFLTKFEPIKHIFNMPLMNQHKEEPYSVMFTKPL